MTTSLGRARLALPVTVDQRNCTACSARAVLPCEASRAAAGSRRSLVAGGDVYFAATTMISTRYCGAASFASTVARAGVLPGETQASHAAFISAKFFMSVM
jgi:hypothetical protein